MDSLKRLPLVHFLTEPDKFCHNIYPTLLSFCPLDIFSWLVGCSSVYQGKRAQFEL